jgi:hypothetical protein
LQRPGTEAPRQGVAGLLQDFGRTPVGLVLAQRPGGVPGLPAGELVRPGFPVGGDAEPPLVCSGQGGERGADAGEMRGPAVGQGEHHAGQERAGGQLPGPDAGGEQCPGERGDSGGAGDVPGDCQRHAHRGHRGCRAG